jgi:hypothetical protein
MATKTRSLELSCPHCMGEDATITLDLGNLDECQCGSCDQTFSPAEAAAMFTAMAEKWEAVAKWVKSAPTS